MIPKKIIINVQEIDPNTGKAFEDKDLTEVQKATARSLLEFFGRNAETISNIFLEAYDEFEEIVDEDEFYE